MPHSTPHPGTWDLWGKRHVGVLGGGNPADFGVHVLVLGSHKQEGRLEAPQPSSMLPLSTGLGVLAIFGIEQSQRDTAKGTGPGWEGGAPLPKGGSGVLRDGTLPPPRRPLLPTSPQSPRDLPSPTVPSPAQLPPFPWNPRSPLCSPPSPGPPPSTIPKIPPDFLGSPQCPLEPLIPLCAPHPHLRGLRDPPRIPLRPLCTHLPLSPPTPQDSPGPPGIPPRNLPPRLLHPADIPLERLPPILPPFFPPAFPEFAPILLEFHSPPRGPPRPPLTGASLGSAAGHAGSCSPRDGRGARRERGHHGNRRRRAAPRGARREAPFPPAGGARGMPGAFPVPAAAAPA